MWTFCWNWGGFWPHAQDYVRAFFLLVQARQKAPHRLDILLMLAQAAQDAGYFDDSAAAYDEYLRLRPDDDTARRDRALASGQTETRREEAGKELAWYLKKYPDDPLGHYIYARVFWWNQPEESLAHLSEAVTPGSRFRLRSDSPEPGCCSGWVRPVNR